jgi:carbonic anhydrase/acetyltransferase-like protein (isoleucine patch superfamily)
MGKRRHLLHNGQELDRDDIVFIRSSPSHAGKMVPINSMTGARMPILIRPDKIRLDRSVFVARNATLTGEITIGKNSSVWFGVVMRGDMAPITIGEETNLQDGALFHVNLGQPTAIGTRVTVGHGAIIHGATVKDQVVIGMGAILLNECVIGENSVVGAGTVVTERTKIPPNSLVLGVPGRVVRPVNQKELDYIQHAYKVYVEYAKHYRKKTRRKR